MSSIIKLNSNLIFNLQEVVEIIKCWNTVTISFNVILESANIRNITTAKATQMIIGAMQSCETYDDTSNETFHANLISGYPRDMNDMKEYNSRVISTRLQLVTNNK